MPVLDVILILLEPRVLRPAHVSRCGHVGAARSLFVSLMFWNKYTYFWGFEGSGWKDDGEDERLVELAVHRVEFRFP